MDSSFLYINDSDDDEKGRKKHKKKPNKILNTATVSELKAFINILSDNNKILRDYIRQREKEGKF